MPLLFRTKKRTATQPSDGSMAASLPGKLLTVVSLSDGITHTRQDWLFRLFSLFVAKGKAKDPPARGNAPIGQGQALSLVPPDRERCGQALFPAAADTKRHRAFPAEPEASTFPLLSGL